MSGSSGGGSIPTINRPQEGENCEGLVINTQLASPKANVINNLNQGDILIVQTVSDQGPINVVDRSGNVAGNVISREQVRLLNCIINGTDYIAEVLSIDNGEVQIQIRAQ